MGWTAGWNMAGYLPEMDPQEFDTWVEARDFLLAELERWDDDEAFLEAHTTIHGATPDFHLAVTAKNEVLWIEETEPKETNEFWMPDTLKEWRGDA
jgi:hypothetical protein